MLGLFILKYRETSEHKRNKQREEAQRKYEAEAERLRQEYALNKDEIKAYQSFFNINKIKDKLSFPFYKLSPIYWLKNFKQDREHPYRIKDWEKYYEGFEQFERHDLALFLKLIKKHGIPDIKNPYHSTQERFQLFHNEFLFCRDMDVILRFFIQDLSQQKHDAYWYDKSLIAEQPHIKSEILKYKQDIEETQEEVKALRFEFEEEIDKLNRQGLSLSDTKKMEYDAKRAILTPKFEYAISQYAELMKKYDVSKYSNEVLRFEKMLDAANAAMILLQYGDSFSVSVKNVIDENNFYYFFAYALCLAQESILKKYRINQSQLLKNSQKLGVLSETQFNALWKLRELINQEPSYFKRIERCAIISV